MGDARLTPIKLTRTKPFAVRFTPQEFTLVQQLAAKYADGNVSAWIRYAATKYELSDLVEITINETPEATNVQSQ